MGGRRHIRSAVRFAQRGRMASRRSRWTVAGAILVVLAFASAFAVRGLRILELRRQLQSSFLARDEALIQRENLEAQLALKDNLDTIEDMARSELGWILPGEVRVVFVDPETLDRSEED